MECVRCDMDNFLTKNHDVPLSLKLSILLDVSYGLVYLHEYNPPIVHRDLTARNILITDSCQAKIADLGVAKIVSLQQQLAQSHTQTPGQMLYMPPEALKEKAECTPKLDIFSFGHLALFTVIQELPKVYNVTITFDAHNNGIIERLKRSRSLDLVGSDHCLYPIITECLYDRPDQRPTTRDLNRQLMHLAALNPKIEPDQEPLVQENHTREKNRIAEFKKEIKDLKETLKTDKQAFEGVIQELEDERDKWKEDFEIAREESRSQKQKITDLEQELVSLKEQIQDLEVAKIECLSAIAAEAEVYKSDFEEERRDREKARGELDKLKEELAKLKVDVRDPKQRKSLKEERLEADLETARASVRALTADVEKLTKQRDDHKYERQKIKVQLSHASQVAIQSTEKVDAARKKKKAAEKALAKAEERIRKLERAQKQPTNSSVTATKAELLYQEERDYNEELRSETNDLRDDIKHYIGIIASLKKLIKVEAAQPGAASEKSPAPPSSDQHFSDHFKNDPNWIPSEPDLTLEEQLKRGFEAAKNATTQKQQIKPYHKTVGHRGLTQAPTPQSMDHRRSQEELLEGAKVKGQDVPHATDQSTGHSKPPPSQNQKNDSPASTPVHHDQGLPLPTLAQQQQLSSASQPQQSQKLPQAWQPLRAVESSVDPLPREGHVQPQHSAPQPQPQYGEHPHVDPRYTDPHHNLPRRGSAQNVVEGMPTSTGGYSPYHPQWKQQQHYPQGRGPYGEQYEQRQYIPQHHPLDGGQYHTKDELNRPGNQQQLPLQQHYSQGSNHPFSSGQYARHNPYHPPGSQQQQYPQHHYPGQQPSQQPYQRRGDGMFSQQDQPYQVPFPQPLPTAAGVKLEEFSRPPLCYGDEQYQPEDYSQGKPGLIWDTPHRPEQ